MDDKQNDQSHQDNQIQNPPTDDAPFSAPDDVAAGVGSTHPATDTNVDSDEAYHEGLGEAAQAFDPEKAEPTQDDETELMADTH